MNLKFWNTEKQAFTHIFPKLKSENVVFNDGKLLSAKLGQTIGLSNLLDISKDNYLASTHLLRDINTLVDNRKIRFLNGYIDVNIRGVWVHLKSI